MIIEKSYNERSYCNNFNALINSIRPNTEINIFVDGSFSVPKKKFAYGFSIVKGNEVLYYETGASNDMEIIQCGSIAAELYSTIMALNFASKYNIRNIKLFYDYVGIYDFSVNKNKRIKYASYYYDVIQEKEKIMNINFCKVKGHHSGNVHHEFVDKLSKKSLSKSL